MIKSLVSIGILGLFMQLVSQDFLYDTSTRTKIVLEAKRLFQKETRLKNKKAAWQARQMSLLKDFNKIYETNNEFGNNNIYGKKRLEKRQREFYMSLQEEDDRLEKSLVDVRIKLDKMKKRFFQLYMVALSEIEMKNGIKPMIIDKDEKIRLLKAYINSQRLWKNALMKNKYFDIKSAKLDNREDFSSQRYNITLTKHDTHKKISRHIQQEYKKKDGYRVKDEKTAQNILKHITN